MLTEKIRNTVGIVVGNQNGGVGKIPNPIQLAGGLEAMFACGAVAMADTYLAVEALLQLNLTSKRSV